MPDKPKTQTTEWNGAANGAAGRTQPFTSSEFLESLNDGREIWIYGERVKDVTTHPAFRNTVRMLARLYDALHAETRVNWHSEGGKGTTSYVAHLQLRPDPLANY